MGVKERKRLPETALFATSAHFLLDDFVKTALTASHFALGSRNLVRRKSSLRIVKIH